MTDEHRAAPSEESHRSTTETAPAVIPAEADEGEITAAESRAKADPDSPAGPNADASGEEFTDPSAQPPA
jgi:hypothetical protein